MAIFASLHNIDQHQSSSSSFRKYYIILIFLYGRLELYIKLKGLDERNSMVQLMLPFRCFRSGASVQEMPSQRHHTPGTRLVVIGVNVIVNLEPTILLIFCSNIVKLYIELKLLLNGIQECKTELSHRCFHSRSCLCVFSFL